MTVTAELQSLLERYVEEHVLHGRTAYEDDRAAGKVRHLKRLWLETEVLKDRPEQFINRMGGHWARKLTISRMDA